MQATRFTRKRLTRKQCQPFLSAHPTVDVAVSSRFNWSLSHENDVFKIQSVLELELGTLLILLLIYIALPAVFLLLRLSSFAIETNLFLLIHWLSTTSESRIEFNLLSLICSYRLRSRFSSV